ncbi:DUF296 domain-containing protein [bacterium]|nr:DUF296 domain-containing protein [bacterium]
MDFKKEGNYYVVSIKRNEEIISSLKEFFAQEKIANAFFQGIGAVKEVELAHYSVADKKYSSFVLKEPLEMVSLLGNVFVDGEKGELIVHAHASFGRPNGELLGGHLVRGIISAACEIIVLPLFSQFKKYFDEETGLKLVRIE